MISPFFLSMMFAYPGISSPGACWNAMAGRFWPKIDAVWVKMIDFKIFNQWPVDSYT